MNDRLKGIWFFVLSEHVCKIVWQILKSFLSLVESEAIAIELAILKTNLSNTV